MIVVPIVIGALGAVSGMCEKYAGKLNVTISFKVIQKAALLGTAGLLQKVLAIQGLKINVRTPLVPLGTCCCCCC